MLDKDKDFYLISVSILNGSLLDNVWVSQGEITL